MNPDLSPNGRRPRWLGPALALLYAASLAAAYALSLRKAGADRPPMNLLASSKGDRVGWIRIQGPIYDSDSRGLVPSGVRAWQKRLRDLSERDDIKAIVLEINSPGGSVGAVQELYSQIERVRSEKKKKVVAVFGDVAASGGYYLASACDKVVAHPGSLVGSIGVIMEAGNIEGLLSKLGVKVDPIKSGAHKDIGSPTRAMTAEEKKILQELIDDAYGQFLEAVSKGRGIKLEDLKPLADGRIFTGRQAKELKLVDQLGDTRDALKLAGELGGIKGEPKIYRSDEHWEDLIGILGSESEALSWLKSVPGTRSAGLEYLWHGF